MSRDDTQKAEIKRTVQAILKTGTSVGAIIRMFASTLNDLGSVEEAQLIRDIADVCQESDP